MNTTFKMGLNSFLKIIFTMLIALLVGAIFILIIGENPIDAYAALFRGAFKGKLKLGTTLAAFTPILLTSTAFIVAAKAGAFNVGVEGEVFLGGIVAAYVGINFTFLPKPLLLIACFVFAALVGAVWAYIPAIPTISPALTSKDKPLILDISFSPEVQISLTSKTVPSTLEIFFSIFRNTSLPIIILVNSTADVFFFSTLPIYSPFLITEILSDISIISFNL